ncbi:MAG: hypothetical protein K9K79_10165 [Desulfohalobiaceae bacterium]|nr:hypothetical protein [Desulfohalobiaceae bacterium]
MPCAVKWILFDFGGVLAEEGFTGGLGTLAEEQGLNPETVQRAGVELVFETGYATGQASGQIFWKALGDRPAFRDRKKTSGRSFWITLYTDRAGFLEQIRVYCTGL